MDAFLMLTMKEQGGLDFLASQQHKGEILRTQAAFIPTATDSEFLWWDGIIVTSSFHYWHTDTLEKYCLQQHVYFMKPFVHQQLQD